MNFIHSGILYEKTNMVLQIYLILECLQALKYIKACGF